MSDISSENGSEALPPEQQVKNILGLQNGSAIEEHPRIFCELQEIKYDKDNKVGTWEEVARWIKFEEDVEEGGDRWTKPHVATLSLHSLFELRSLVMHGTVLLAMQAKEMVDIIDLVLENMTKVTKQLPDNPETVRIVRDQLLSHHLHASSKKLIQ